MYFREKPPENPWKHVKELLAVENLSDKVAHCRPGTLLKQNSFRNVSLGCCKNLQKKYF